MSKTEPANKASEAHAKLAAYREVRDFLAGRIRDLEQAMAAEQQAESIVIPLGVPTDSKLWGWLRDRILEPHKQKHAGFSYRVEQDQGMVRTLYLPSTLPAEHRKEIESAAAWCRKRATAWS